MRAWLESAANLGLGIVRRWVGFLPAGILGFASLLGVQVPSSLIWTVLVLGAVLAVVGTYHELRRQLFFDMFEYRLLPEQPNVDILATDWSGSMSLQPRITLRNDSDRPLRYRLETMAAVLGGRSVANPVLLDREGVVGPRTATQCRYDAIVPVQVERQITGTIEYTLVYGPANRPAVLRSHRKFSLEMRRRANDWVVDSSIQEQSDTRIEPPTIRSVLRRATPWNH